MSEAYSNEGFHAKPLRRKKKLCAAGLTGLLGALASWRETVFYATLAIARHSRDCDSPTPL
jgi:hypothetical protein